MNVIIVKLLINLTEHEKHDFWVPSLGYHHILNWYFSGWRIKLVSVIFHPNQSLITGRTCDFREASVPRQVLLTVASSRSINAILGLPRLLWCCADSIEQPTSQSLLCLASGCVQSFSFPPLDVFAYWFLAGLFFQELNVAYHIWSQYVPVRSFFISGFRIISGGDAPFPRWTNGIFCCGLLPIRKSAGYIHN